MYFFLVAFLLDHRIFVCVHEKVFNTYAFVENNSINKTIICDPVHVLAQERFYKIRNGYGTCICGCRSGFVVLVLMFYK